MSPILSIVITHPHQVKHEAEAIVALLDAGVSYVHVRKPGWTDVQVTSLLASIPTLYHPQLTVHYHHALSAHFGIGGLHHSRHHAVVDARNCRVSRSCHALDEVRECNNQYDYLLLSPIFNSISKAHYQAKFQHDELRAFLSGRMIDAPPVIALGGISVATAPVARQLGFDGFALLGAVWRMQGDEVEVSQSVSQYQQIVSAWMQ